MELLEREQALAGLAEAREAAARGDGRVVVVAGEPGIGKTSLVTRFVADLEPGSRVLVGTCDDLSIPRPLGAIHDLAGSVSPALEEALAAEASPHEIHRLLLDELALPPRPTVLVLEDVHWADEATLDVITVLARRIGSLPVLLVLTCRDGEVPPGHPVYAVRQRDRRRCLELDAPVRGRGRVALRRRRRRRLRRHRRQPVLRHRAARLAHAPTSCRRSIANAVRGRLSRLSDDERRLVELVSVVPNRVTTSVLDAVMPDWPAAAEEPERRAAARGSSASTCASATSSRGTRSGRASRSRRDVGCTPRSSRRCWQPSADPADIVHHAEAAGAENVVADYALVAARRAAALDSNREAYSHYRRASAFLDRLPAHERAAVLEELATAAYAVYRLDDAFRRSSARSRSGPRSTTGRPSAAAPRSSRGSTGTRATATPRGRRRSRRSRSSSRSASPSSSRAPTAASHS